MSQTTTANPLVAQAVQAVLEEPLPFRITAYDGTDIGPRDSDIAVRVESEEGLRYLLSAPGDLGLARAYLTGTLTGTGFHPGDPYEVFSRIKRDVRTKQLTPKGVASALAPVVKQLGPKAFVHPPLPEVENEPRWKRHLAKVNPVSRAADSIKHHYDVSNAFYEKVLGDSMAYTCAVFDTPDDTLEDAQERKFALVADKLDLQPGQRLLDVGCGWGGMAMHAARERGVHVIGVTLSKEQAEWGQRAVREASGSCEAREGVSNDGHPEGEGLGRLLRRERCVARGVPREQIVEGRVAGLEEGLRDAGRQGDTECVAQASCVLDGCEPRPRAPPNLDGAALTDEGVPPGTALVGTQIRGGIAVR